MKYSTTVFIFCLFLIPLMTGFSQAQAPDFIEVENLDDEIGDAIFKDDADFIRESIRQGLKVNTRDRNGMTYLHQAAFLGAEKSMELLLEAGAPVDAMDNEGRTALIIICGVTPYLSELSERSPEFALRYPKLEPETLKRMIGLLLKYHADPNIACGLMGGALHAVAARGTPELCELLLDAGANIDLCLGKNETPLFMAVMTGKIDNVRYLISKGADVDLGDKYSPLYYAVLMNDLEIGKILVEAGADVNCAWRGETALGFARERGHREFEMLLLAHGAREITE